MAPHEVLPRRQMASLAREEAESYVLTYNHVRGEQAGVSPAAAGPGPGPAVSPVGGGDQPAVKSSESVHWAPCRREEDCRTAGA